MSLQSGSDSVLRRMQRFCSTRRYAEKIEAIRSEVADISITTDIIVGFPGETDSEHEQSLAFIERMQFAQAHVFTYSRRAGTAAAELPHPVTHAVKRERYAAMKAVTGASEEAFRRKQLGENARVLWERREPSGTYSGLSDNYLRVYTSACVTPNTISSVALERTSLALT